MTLTPDQMAAARRTISEFIRSPDSGWEADAKRAFRGFCPGTEGLRDISSRTAVEYAEALFSKLEDAAAHVGCSLESVWKAGIHFIPGSNLASPLLSEGFVLRHVKGKFSPFVIEPRRIILQVGSTPSAFRYDLGTDMRHMFEYAISPGSFF